jgi:hypothetical protein
MLLMMGSRRAALVLAGLLPLAAACGDDANDRPATGAITVPVPATAPATTAPDTSATAPSSEPEPTATSEPIPEPIPESTTTSTTSTEPKIELPVGVLVAVPTQNREDPAKNQFQVQIHNGTRDRYDLAGVQFRWAGYSTPMTERDSIIVGGQIIDFPVPFPGATCVGDGLIGAMPSVDDARVVLLLDDGTEVEVPVIDQWHLARKLYLEDCEKQMIESQVAIEWVDLHEEEFEGRPVTAGELRLTRRDGTGEITIVAISNTIPYEFVAVDTAVDEPVAVLTAGAAEVSVPVRFLESRCDPHALAEVKQPTKFISQVQLGDGSLHPYIIYPERDYWVEMRLTADEACVILGEVVFVGDD